MTSKSSVSGTVLVVADVVAATQFISFQQAFAGAGDDLGFVLQPDLPDAAGIADRFARVAPRMLILSRVTDETGQIWIGLARKAGIPAIFHLDDDLLAVPKSLGAKKFEHYNKPGRIQSLRDNIEGCDMVYASTTPLAETLRAHGIRTPIKAGDIYCSVDPARIGRSFPAASGPVIGYMGTGTHAADLEEIVPALERSMLAFPDLQFECFGGLEIPGPLRRFAGRVRTIAPVAGYAEFVAKMQTLGWWIGLAPLRDTTFNRCKADTKWVEYSFSGMATIAADLPVYHRACQDGAGIPARTNDEWTAAISLLLTDRTRRLGTAAAAQNKLRRRYSHPRLRAQVRAILDLAGASAVAA